MGTAVVPPSCAGLQSRSFSARAGGARSRSRIADEPEGKADQDRREGHAPRPLRRIPAGRGGHSTKSSPTSCGSSRNFDRRQSHQRVKRSFRYASGQITGATRLDDGTFGNFQRWRQLILLPSIVRADGAGLSKTRKRSKLASGPAQGACHWNGAD